MNQHNPSRRDLLKSVCVGAVTVAVQNAPTLATREDRPNVILIMTDDQGYGDFGVTGNPIIMTPNIDAMARRSGSMKNFYVHPVCTPTRACLMTGRYNYRTRAIDTDLGRAMMEPEEITLAEILRDAGYATGIFGKWHLGDNYPMRPMDQGFSESLVHRGGGIGQPSDPTGGEGKYTDPILLDNGKLKQFKGYCTDIFFDRAINWIFKCVSDGENFFTYIPTNAPHRPLQDVPEDLYKRYKKMNLSNEAFPQDKGHPLPVKTNQDDLARIFAMITNIDDNMGKLFKILDNLGVTENTIIIFLVDNGPDGRRYVAGMRGSKRDVYEGGIRSPFFFQWPGVVKPGQSSELIAAHIDVLPTILDACRVRKPAGLKLDGRNLLPLLKGEPVKWTDRTIYIQAHLGNKPLLYHNFAARSQQWKLLHASGFSRESFKGEPKFELYDMVSGPLEQNNLAAERPDIVEKMRKEYEAWFADVSSTRPDNYAPPRIYFGTRHENPVVLTRQDWRHYKGRPWAKDSNGYWELYAAQSGKYNVRLRFPQTSTNGTIVLEFAGLTFEKNFQTGRQMVEFEEIDVKKGNCRLLATLKFSKKDSGPHQVDIFW